MAQVAYGTDSLLMIRDRNLGGLTALSPIHNYLVFERANLLSGKFYRWSIDYEIRPIILYTQESSNINTNKTLTWTIYSNTHQLINQVTISYGNMQEVGLQNFFAFEFNIIPAGSIAELTTNTDLAGITCYCAIDSHIIDTFAASQHNSAFI